MNTKFYQVGGSVRDKFLGVKSKDIDYAVEAESFDAMRQAIIARGGKIFVETPQYFTIRAHVPDLGATDYTLCRKDGTYKDGRHPESVTIGTIYDDLARRDFTCNAMAIDTTTNDLIDPFGGVADTKNQLLCCVGDTNERMREDALRALRALRFSVTKNFDIAWILAHYIINMKQGDFGSVSTERIRDEIFRMFQAYSSKSMKLLVNTYPNILQLIEDRNIWFKPTTELVK